MKDQISSLGINKENRQEEESVNEVSIKMKMGTNFEGRSRAVKGIRGGEKEGWRQWH